MNDAHLEGLETGDLIRHTAGSEGYLVCANYGEAGVIVTRTLLISNPLEWDLIRKANHFIPLNEES